MKRLVLISAVGFGGVWVYMTTVLMLHNLYDPTLIGDDAVGFLARWTYIVIGFVYGLGALGWAGFTLVRERPKRTA